MELKVVCGQREKLGSGMENARALHSSVYMSKLTITYPLCILPLRHMHIQRLQFMHFHKCKVISFRIHLLDGHTTPRRSLVWFLCFLPCHSILFRFLFHNCLITVAMLVDYFFFFGSLSECTTVQLIWR